MRTLSDQQIRAIHAKAASRGPVARFFVRNPGVKTTLKRLAIVGAGAGALTAFGLRNRRLIRTALQEELPGLRGTLRHVRGIATRRQSFLRKVVAQEQAFDRAGQPHMAAQVWRLRKGAVPPRASRGLESWVRSIEHRIRGVKADAVRRARSTDRVVRVGGIGLAAAGGTWALYPAVEDRERHLIRKEQGRERGFVVVTKKRRKAA